MHNFIKIFFFFVLFLDVFADTEPRLNTCANESVKIIEDVTVKYIEKPTQKEGEKKKEKNPKDKKNKELKTSKTPKTRPTS